MSKIFEAIKTAAEKHMAELKVPGIALGIIHDGTIEMGGIGITNLNNPQHRLWTYPVCRRIHRRHHELDCGSRFHSFNGKFLSCFENSIILGVPSSNTPTITNIKPKSIGNDTC